MKPLIIPASVLIQHCWKLRRLGLEADALLKTHSDRVDVQIVKPSNQPQLIMLTSCPS
jgi:hypothetical protein